MNKKTITIIILIITLVTQTINTSGSRLIDNIIISIDYKSLGYTQPPMIMASIMLPEVATLTPTSVDAKRGKIEIRIEGIRGMFEEYRSTGAVAGPTITLALIDYENMSIRVRQVILTPLTLAILKHGNNTNIISLKNKVTEDPLLPYKSVLNTLKINIDKHTLNTISTHGITGTTIIQKGTLYNIKNNAKPMLGASDTLKITNLNLCIKNSLELVHYNTINVYKNTDTSDPFYGFLVNGSTPKFWVDHVPHDPEGTWRTLVSSAYAAVYYIEYTPDTGLQSVDEVLESAIPGINAYIRSYLQTTNPQATHKKDYRLLDNMKHWLGPPVEDRWLDTRDLYGVTEVTASNVPLLQVTYNTTQYTGNPNILAVSAVVDVFSTHQSITGFGLLGFYTSSVAIHRNAIQPGIAYVPPDSTIYYYGDVTYSLGSDVGVLLFDVVGLGVDSCGEYWIIVEPLFIYYVDVVPLINTIQVDTTLPGNPSMVYVGKTGYQLYYTKILDTNNYNNEPHIIATWSKAQFYDSKYMFYVASPPGLNLIQMLLSWSQAPPATYIINMLSLLSTIIYERSNYTDVGVNIQVSISKTGSPPKTPVKVDWRVETLRYFLVYGGGEPLPLVGSKMTITLTDAQP